MGSKEHGLDWIDGFMERIRPYIYVRLADNALIKLPNQVFKLNSTGARVLHHLLSGGSIKDIVKARHFDKELPSQLHSFFTDLSRMLSSTVCEIYQSPTLERVRFDLGYIELPVLSELAVTWRCNIKCKFCYASCRCVSEPFQDASMNELSTNDLKRVLDIIRNDADVPSVSFTGGEPLLRNDLVELISYATSINLRVNLITNGTLISEKIAKDLKEAGLVSAQVSIESPDPSIHDNIVGVVDGFRASLNGLRALKNAGIFVHPHATICQLNIHTLSETPHFAKSLGMERFSMNMIIPAGRGVEQELTVKYSDIKEIVLKIKSIAEAVGIKFMWYSPTPLCLFNPVAHQLGNKGCSACEGLLSIDPYGRIIPCSSWREPLGNLLQQGFKELWFGTRGKFLRDKQFAHPGCRDCEHFALCHGACPLYFSVHGYKELEPAFANLLAKQHYPRNSVSKH